MSDDILQFGKLIYDDSNDALANINKQLPIIFNSIPDEYLPLLDDVYRCVNCKALIHKDIRTIVYTFNDSIFKNSLASDYFPTILPGFYARGSNDSFTYVFYICNIIHKLKGYMHMYQDKVQSLRKSEFPLLQDYIVIGDKLNANIYKIKQIFSFFIYFFMAHACENNQDVMLFSKKIAFLKKIVRDDFNEEINVESVTSVYVSSTFDRKMQDKLFNDLYMHFSISVENSRKMFLCYGNIIKCNNVSDATVDMVRNTFLSMIELFDEEDQRKRLQVYLKAYTEIVGVEISIQRLQYNLGLCHTRLSRPNTNTKAILENMVMIHHGIQIYKSKIRSIYKREPAINLNRDIKISRQLKSILNDNTIEPIMSDIGTYAGDEQLAFVLLYHLRNELENKNVDVDPDNGVHIDFIEPTLKNNVVETLNSSSSSSSPKNNSRFSRLVRTMRKKETSAHKRGSSNLVKALKEAFLINKNHVYPHHPDKITLVSMLPITATMDVTLKFATFLDAKNRPPRFLRYYFPDLYSQVCKDPTQKVYKNDKRYDFLKLQERLVKELDPLDKKLLTAWTDDGYKGITRLITLLFDIDCSNKYDLLNTREKFEKALDEIIVYFNQITLFDDEVYEAFIPDTYLQQPYEDSLEFFRNNNYEVLRLFINEYVKALYRISDTLKQKTEAILGKDAIDEANIYLFRGQKDTSYRGCKDSQVSCVRSTSLNFLTAIEFSDRIQYHKDENNRANSKRFVKGNMYIYRLNNKIPFIYMVPISQYPSEQEVLILPTDRRAFLQKLERVRPFVLKNALSNQQRDRSSSSSSDYEESLSRLMNRLTIRDNTYIKTSEVPLPEQIKHQNKYIEILFNKINKTKNMRIKVCEVTDP